MQHTCSSLPTSVANVLKSEKLVLSTETMYEVQAFTLSVDVE